MSRKKDTNITISSQDEIQIQQILEQYHQIASELHESTSRQQADKALASIYNMSEDAQLALLKTLSKEQNSDSADVLLAINELSPNKAVRKEAHRSLIRLTSARIYPSWTPAEEQALVTAPHPPRFWKGEATQMREGGEVQLILCWEQGLDYGEARMFGFLLDFWKDGVKDCFVEENSKRRIEAMISRMHERNEPETPQGNVGAGVVPALVDCTLAEGRRLLLEALSVNKWHGTQPHEEYRRHLPVIQQFILNANDVGIDRGNDFISPDLEPDEVVAHFIGGWSLGDYGLCYDLLSRDVGEGLAPALGENLERDEWIDQRRKWYDEAHPARMQYGFIREREHNQQSLWLPSSFISSRASTQRDVAAGWSVEIVDTPLSGTLPEMPMGTAVNKETGRHWFWTSYILVQQEGKWRIQSMKDEGARAQGLSIAELQDRLKEYDDRIQEITKKHAPNEPGTEKLYEEILWRMIESMHYDDALLAKLPLDRTIYEDAFSRAMSLNNAERALVYLNRAVERFTTSRAGLLLQLGATQAALANLYFQRGMEERSDRFMNLAEASLREALAIEDSVLGHILLAEVLVGKDEDEAAEAELQQAKALNPTASEEVQIEADLGDIAMERKHYEQALRHFLRVAQLEPNHPGIWFRIGYAYRLLENYVDAEASFQRALEADPHDLLAYSELASVYMNTDRLSKAQETLEQGLHVNPDSAQLRALLASVLLEKGNRRRAEELLKEAERINPDLELVRLVRQSLEASKVKRR